MKIIRNILVASILFVCIQAQSQTLEEFRKTPIENSSHSDAVELEFPVLPEVPYEIFGSPDLKTWETLEAGITDENPKVRRFYQVEGSPRRFFRTTPQTNLALWWATEFSFPTRLGSDYSLFSNSGGTEPNLLESEIEGTGERIRRFYRLGNSPSDIFALEKKPSIRTIAFMGDSLSTGTKGDGTVTQTTLQGFMWPIFTHNGQSLTLVKSSLGTNFNTGGMQVSEIRDFWLPQVVSASPDVCFLMGGTNSIGFAILQNPDTDSAAEWIFTQLAQILDTLDQAGIRAIIATVTPDSYTIDDTTPPEPGTKSSDYRIIRKKLNDLIRTRAPSHGAVVCDWAHVISTDPNDETASANVGYLSDELHYNFGGEWALGHFAADVIRKNFEIGTEWQYPGQNSPMWITTNPFMTGETQSGLADGWQILTSSGVEVTTSKTPEGWQRISCTSGGQPGEIKSLRLRKFLSVTDDRLDGQDFQAVFDIRPASDGWNIWAASATISCSSSSPQIERIGLNPNISNPNILKLQTEIAPHTDRILFRTPVVTQPIGGIRLIVITLTILGEGTFDVVAGGAFRVVQ